MSLAIHLIVVAVLTLVAVRAAMEPAQGPERYMDFDDAGAEPVLDELPTREDSQPSSAVASTPAPIAPQPPTLASDAVPVVPVAVPRDEAAPSAEPASDAWLAPASATPDAGATPGERPSAELPPSSAAPPGGDVKFAGLGSSNARSVVYAVDASGPMVTTLPEIIDELVRSVSRLSPTQRFGVVVFRLKADGTTSESFMPVLVRATPQAKKEVREWLLSLAPAGRSNPLAGLRTAMELRPDAIFLLSRGIERSGGGLWDLGLDAIMEELDRLNPADERTGRRDVVIKTIQFLDEDPTGTMQRIGQVHGQGVSREGRKLPGYRVVKRGSELAEDPIAVPEEDP